MGLNYTNLLRDITQIWVDIGDCVLYVIPIAVLK